MLTAAGIASVGATAALAGGPDVPPAQPPVASDNGVYVEGMVGYGRINWSAVNVASAGLTRSLGGFIGGADFGYQWNSHWAFELGWLGFPCVGTTAPLRITGGVAYAVAKWMVPLWSSHADITFKFGVSYRYHRVFGVTVNMWRPVFGVGLQYMFAQNWWVGAQYMRVFGSNATIRGIVVPSANLFTVNFGYLFAL